MENSLHFKNGKFKIMQITDTQEIHCVNPDTVKLISLALDREKPDLVVFTGDQIKGYSATFKGNTRQKITETLGEIFRPVIERKIPFTATFGNHDRDCGIGNNVQAEIYKSFPGFVSGAPRHPDDVGTFLLELKDSNNEKSIFALYLIDSNAKDKKAKAYSPVFKDQVEWYKKERDRLKAENGALLPALVFQHIPVPEIFRAIKRVKKGTRGAVEAFYSHSGEFYTLFDDTLSKGGFMHESPAAPDINNGEFEAMREKGDVLGIFFGHDHINSFVKNVDGIDLGYTQGAGFNVYGPGKRRGVRVFILDENNLRNYQNYTVTMDELCVYRPAKPLTEFFFTHTPSSVKQVEKAAKKAGVFLAAAAVCAAVIKKVKPVK